MITNSPCSSSYIFDAISVLPTNKHKGECLALGLMDHSFALWQVASWWFVLSTGIYSIKYLEYVYRTFWSCPDNIFNTDNVDFKVAILEKEGPEKIKNSYLQEAICQANPPLLPSCKLLNFSGGRRIPGMEKTTSVYLCK